MAHLAGTATRLDPVRLAVWPAIGVALLLTALGTGIAPLLPLVAVAGLAIVVALPTRWSAGALLFLALVGDNPGERPAAGIWDSPLAPIGDLLYQNLHKLTHIEALRFSALELLVAVLLGVVVLRKLVTDPIDDPHDLGPLPNPMKIAFASFFAAIVALEVFGVARGGDFKNSLWQVRQMFWLPLLGILFGHSFKDVGARRGVLRIILAAAFFRSLTGIWCYFMVARPQGLNPPYTTTHSDSVLSVVAILIAAMALVERPNLEHLVLNAVLQPVFLVAMIVNNRRIAFVHLAVGLFVMVLIGPPQLRRALKQGIAVLVPVALLYVAVGWNSNAGVFRPIKILKSVTEQKDDSSKTRDIENYNLVQTLKASPLVGSGFGHEYHEVVQANRVDQYFAQYKYIAHNSVLWLLSLAGWLGFTFVWVLLPVAVLVTIHVHRRAVHPIDRTTAFASYCALACFAMQAWGDMGLQSWLASLLVTSLTGATGALWTEYQRAEESPA